MGMRNWLRHVALSVLAKGDSVFRDRSRVLQQKRVHFLYFHHLFSDEVANFRRLLHILSKDHVLIGYSEAVDRVVNGNIDGNYITISFDDGFKNNLQAAEVLKEFGVTGCFFVCGAFIGIDSHAEIKRFCQEILHLPPLEPMTWSDLESLRSAGHEIGAHTMTHSNLRSIPHGEAEQEIAAIQELLQDRLGAANHFSWPYGTFQDINPRVAKYIFDLGFTSCASAVRGCHMKATTTSRVCIRRDHIIAAWPLGHTLYLISRSVRKGAIGESSWPQGWERIVNRRGS